MSEPFRRVAEELRRLDDELAAAVTLPTPDSVIRRAGVFNRASTAAAVAVTSVGALGAMTAVASVTTPVRAGRHGGPARLVAGGQLRAADHHHDHARSRHDGGAAAGRRWSPRRPSHRSRGSRDHAHPPADRAAATTTTAPPPSTTTTSEKPDDDDTTDESSTTTTKDDDDETTKDTSTADSAAGRPALSSAGPDRGPVSGSGAASS